MFRNILYDVKRCNKTILYNILCGFMEKYVQQLQEKQGKMYLGL
jgi:hypothetical protein